jgi:uncharacterized membrane protein YkvA (DUF1232 family)
MAILDNLEAYLEFEDENLSVKTFKEIVCQDCLDKENLDPSWKDAPDWCDDCNSNPGEKCPDCGYTHNC